MKLSFLSTISNRNTDLVVENFDEFDEFTHTIINILLMNFITSSKFSRDVNFAVFTVNLSSTKFKPLK